MGARHSCPRKGASNREEACKGEGRGQSYLSEKSDAFEGDGVKFIGIGACLSNNEISVRSCKLAAHVLHLRACHFATVAGAELLKF